MPDKVVVMLDGGHLRVLARKAGKHYDPAYIEKVGHACALPSEAIHRIMYYDCAPFTGSDRLPVSEIPGLRDQLQQNSVHARTAPHRQ